MGDFEFRVEIKENVRKRLGDLLPKSVEESIAAVAREVRNQVLVNATGRVLKVRSGALRRSWSGMPSVHRRGMQTTATVGSQANPYAAIHEFGMQNLRAVRAAHLAIPLEAMRKSSGEARASARDVIANPGAWGFEGTFFRKRLLFGKRGKTIVPLFALRESVNIPARKYITLAIDQASRRAQGIVNAAIVRVIRERAEGGGA